MSFDREEWLRNLRAEERPEGYFFTHARFMPDALYKDPEEYKGEDAIAVACTQIGDEKEQRRLVKAWSSALPKLNNLRRIHFLTRFPDALLEPLSQAIWLEEVHIKWSGLKQIGCLVRLDNLQSLHLGSSPSIADPESVSNLKSLRRLSLENIRALYDVSWIAEMAPIEELALNGSMWGTQKVQSLAPLVKLPNLKRLQVIATQVKERDSLMALASMPSLQVLDTHEMWPKGMLRGLTELRPDLWVNGRRGPDWQESKDSVMDLS